MAAVMLALFLAVSFPAPCVYAAETKAPAKIQHHAAKKTPAKHAAAKKTTTTKKTVASKKRTAQKPAAYNPRYASIVMDAETGAVLSQSGADNPVYPASLTKMMTLLIVFERLEEGTVSLSQRVTMSNHAANQAPSKLGLPAGSSIELKNAIYAIVTKSANDIAMAVGEHVGGSEGHFVYLMNEKAKTLGMTRTHFSNPTGLHNTDQVTTARDFARLSRYIITHYPREYRYFSTKSFNYNGTANRNHNHLMETYAGMDGIKTGYIQPSGFNLAASAVRNNRRLIAIVFGGKTAQTRNNQVAALLNEGFAKINSPRPQPLAVSQNTLTDPRLNAVQGTAGLPAQAIPARTPPAELAYVTAQAQPSPPGPSAASLAETEPAAPPQQSGALVEMAGEGDIDPVATRRLETGMMAIAAIKSTLKPGQVSRPPLVPDAPARTAMIDPAGAPTPVSDTGDNWSIQLGSFASRVKGDEVLNAAIAKLPAAVKGAATPVIVPLKAGDGWVYRARLRGFSRDQASAACGYFNSCMTISPRAF